MGEDQIRLKVVLVAHLARGLHRHLPTDDLGLEVTRPGMRVRVGPESRFVGDHRQSADPWRFLDHAEGHHPVLGIGTQHRHQMFELTWKVLVNKQDFHGFEF